MDSDEDVSPTGLIRRAWTFFPAAVNFTVIGLLLLAGLVFGIQQIVFQADNQNIRHTKDTQQSQNANIQGNSDVQQGYVNAISSDVATVDSYIVQAQGAPNQAMMISAAVGYGNQACLEASYLTGSYHIAPQMQDWINANCSGGALRPDSPIRSGKGN